MIDTQYVLPKGTTEDVKKEVKRRINDFGRRGGYILNAVRNIQPVVPPQNIVTMYKNGKEFSRSMYQHQLFE